MPDITLPKQHIIELHEDDSWAFELLVTETEPGRFTVGMTKSMREESDDMPPSAEWAEEHEPWNTAIDAVEWFLIAYVAANNGQLSDALFAALKQTMNTLINEHH